MGLESTDAYDMGWLLVYCDDCKSNYVIHNIAEYFKHVSQHKG